MPTRCTGDLPYRPRSDAAVFRPFFIVLAVTIGVGALLMLLG